MRIHGTAEPNRGHRPGRHVAGPGLAVCVPAVAALWLLFAAIPVFADGGPHMVNVNNGSTGLNADSCAGCHRAHTSKDTSGFLLTGPGTGINDFCRACHGALGAGAATNVDNGVQYTLNTRVGTTGTELGALRGGGFVSARIGSSSAYRIVTNVGQFRTKVPVLATDQPITSAHLAITGSGITAKNVVWGNGDISATPFAGPALNSPLVCTSCHNPHGNGNFRILEPIPDLTSDVTGGTFLTVASPGALVTDAALPPSGDTRNYTVIQVPGTGSLLASQASGYPSTAGDYFHRRVPWNTSSNADAPNGLVSTFNPQMNAWCTACHTRYDEPNAISDSGDGIFRFRHVTLGDGRACTTCHVAHGSNAKMQADPTTGTAFSRDAPYPNGSSASGFNGNSRLLKIDNRGTCQACHDPTGTSFGTTSGPTPVPFTP